MGVSRSGGSRSGVRQAVDSAMSWLADGDWLLVEMLYGAEMGI